MPESNRHPRRNFRRRSRAFPLNGSGLGFYQFRHSRLQSLSAGLPMRRRAVGTEGVEPLTAFSAGWCTSRRVICPTKPSLALQCRAPVGAAAVKRLAAPALSEFGHMIHPIVSPSLRLSRWLGVPAFPRWL